MSNVKHTPGPWRTFNVTDIFPDDDDRQGLMHIADCAMSGAMGAAEIAANARLIAAAPDLLGALKAAREDILDYWLPTTAKGDDNKALLIHRIDRAIDKAEGRS